DSDCGDVIPDRAAVLEAIELRAAHGHAEDTVPEAGGPLAGREAVRRVRGRDALLLAFRWVDVGLAGGKHGHQGDEGSLLRAREVLGPCASDGVRVGELGRETVRGVRLARLGREREEELRWGVPPWLRVVVHVELVPQGDDVRWLNEDLERAERAGVLRAAGPHGVASRAARAVRQDVHLVL